MNKFFLYFLLLISSHSLFAAIIIVTPTDNLSQSLVDALPGDTILIQPGTYTASTTTANPHYSVFWVYKSLTIDATDPANPPILKIPGSEDRQVLWLTSSNITVSNIKTQGDGLNAGVLVQSQDTSTLTNIILNNITVSNDVTQLGHGILFDAVTDSVINSCVVENAGDNGIYLLESSNITVMNNQVQHTERQHAIAVQQSNNIDIVNNTVTESAFHGIIVLESDHNNIVGNSVSGQQYDGITLTDRSANPGVGSKFNYIAHNNISSTSPNVDGTGLWLNSESNYNVIYANIISGFPENGLSVWLSSGNYMFGNVITDNNDGGIFFWDPNNAIYSTGTVPKDNVIHNNYVYDNIYNAQINLRYTSTADIAYNFMSGTNLVGTTGSLMLGISGDPVGNEGASDVTVYHNTILDFLNSEFIYPNVSQTTLFRNRHFNITDIFTTSPAGVVWNSTEYIGGNFYSHHVASGNPSTTTPFSDIIYNAPGSDTGLYVDLYPFESENFGKSYTLSIMEPYQDTVASINSVKSIRWKSTGCVYVNLSYRSGGVTTSIVTNYPDVGYYKWTVPSISVADDYQIVATCLNSAKASTSVADSSNSFSVVNDGLKLLLPVRYQQVDSSTSTMRVAWLSDYTSSDVEVFLKYDETAWMSQGSTTDSYMDISIPAVSSSTAKILIVDTLHSNTKDTLDGYFSIRDFSGSFIALTDFKGNKVASNSNIKVGDSYTIEWISPEDSSYVHISYWDGSSWINIQNNLPDIGRYTWFVPDDLTQNSKLNISTKDQSGMAISGIESQEFNIAYNTGTSLPVIIMYLLN